MKLAASLWAQGREYNPLCGAASVRYMTGMAGAGYDTIIIGAGSAGCVLAARLGEDGARRILVLEAGGADDHWLIHIPLGVGKVWNNPRWNWDYTGEPEPHVDQRRIYHPRGKVLGGSSSINIMAYVRCHRLDYDRLPQSGLRGWSYADVLPYFKRAESFADGGSLYRGGNGPLKTRRSPAEDYIYDAFVAAAPELGSSANDDYNAADQKGFGRLQHTIGSGKRCSTAVAYLRPAMARGNVTVETRAHATKLIIESGRAIGVEYVVGSERREARAESEVIVSAGTYNSPQLLMLSGIGPAEELRALGIAPRVDLAGVGPKSVGSPDARDAMAQDARGKLPSRLAARPARAEHAPSAFLRHRICDAASWHRHSFRRQYLRARRARSSVFLRRRRVSRARMVPDRAPAGA